MFTRDKSTLYFNKLEIYESETYIENIIILKDSCIVLNWGKTQIKDKPESNVICIDSLGNKIWEIQPAPIMDGDFYTAIAVIDKTLKVRSSSCYEFTLNPETGELTDKEFTK